MRPAMMLLTVALATSAVASVQAADASSEKTNVTGKAFVDLTHVDQRSDGNTTDASGTGVDAKRFYVGIDHAFGDLWSANVTTDFNYVSNDSQTQVYIKKAYLQANVSDALVARLGSADLPWVPFVEGIYGYRYVENVLVEHLKFGTSADWGVHAAGKAAAGAFSYAVSAINGGGYKNPTRTQSMDVEGRVSVVPVKGLTLAAGFYNGKLGQDRATVSPQHTAQRVDALVAYATAKLRLGAEYVQADNWRQVLSSSADKASGYSAWASFDVSSGLSVFARYDDAKPSKTLAPNLENTYVNAGIALHPRKNLDLAIAYKQDKTDSGSLLTSNGTIGGTRSGKFEEFGIWGQVGF